MDSDEAAIEGAIAFAKRKKPRVLGGKNGNNSGVRPDDNFVGVKLSAQGVPTRVFINDE